MFSLCNDRHLKTVDRSRWRKNLRSVEQRYGEKEIQDISNGDKLVVLSVEVERQRSGAHRSSGDLDPEGRFRDEDYTPPRASPIQGCIYGFPLLIAVFNGFHWSLTSIY